MRAPTGRGPLLGTRATPSTPRCSSRRRRARHALDPAHKHTQKGARRDKAWAYASRRNCFRWRTRLQRWYECDAAARLDSSPGRWRRATDSRPGQIGSRARAHSREAAVDETVEQALDVRVRPTGGRTELPTSGHPLPRVLLGGPMVPLAMAHFLGTEFGTTETSVTGSADLGGGSHRLQRCGATRKLRRSSTSAKDDARVDRSGTKLSMR
jgi:hypothetical protein